MSLRVRRRALWALLLAGACQPNTTRPAFGPLPTAPQAVVDLEVGDATTKLAEALKADTIPVSRVAPRDGYLETGWFVPGSGALTEAWPLGDSVVRVRAWVNAYGHDRASITVETALRPLANPSLPPRELDRQASDSNPAAIRVARVLDALALRYPVPGAAPPPAPPKPAGVTPDSTTPAPPDSAAPAGQVIEKKRPPIPPGAK